MTATSPTSVNKEEARQEDDISVENPDGLLVDLGDAKTETKGSAGGFLDTAGQGHY